MRKLDVLVSCLSKLPGIGPKSAERIAYHIAGLPENEINELAAAILSVKEGVYVCRICCNYSETPICSICSDEKRDKETICVVKEPQDIAAIERLNIYRGSYHVLGGVLSAKRNKTPQDLYINQLIERIKNNNVKEVILAIDPDVEGEMTMNYLSRLLKDYNLKVSRISIGIPAGGEIEYADNITLTEALSGKKEI
jgi:recombination protein RecR